MYVCIYITLQNQRNCFEKKKIILEVGSVFRSSQHFLPFQHYLPDFVGKDGGVAVGDVCEGTSVDKHRRTLLTKVFKGMHTWVGTVIVSTRVLKGLFVI